LQAIAAAMKERHLRHLVMEVSSHSIALKRIIGSHFSAVGFTNLSQDHLDFHQDMESYYQVKAALFTHEYADIAFINIDNPYGARLFSEADIPAVSLSRSDVKAEWHFTEIHPTATGIDWKINGFCLKDFVQELDEENPKKPKKEYFETLDDLPLSQVVDKLRNIDADTASMDEFLADMRRDGEVH
jgi:UDP-N-acetylmuramoylalanine-D-glutamate ligase